MVKTLNVKLPDELFLELRGLKGDRKWKEWLRTVRDDLRKAREEIAFYRDQLEFCKNRLENADQRMIDLLNNSKEQIDSMKLRRRGMAL